MKFLRVCCMITALPAFLGCAALQRGMSGAAYVSTARPAIALQAARLPLLAAGEGRATLFGDNMPAGAQARVWLAVYGDVSPESPLAVAAHAEVQSGWYWDGIMRRPFSVNEGVEIVGGREFQACTYIVGGERDPFGAFAPGDADRPARWIARGLAARTNFYADKIILEYRERLPESITSLTALPLGYGNFVREFEQRARESFIVTSAPPETAEIRKGYANAVRWRYMNEKFLGTVSKYDNISRP
ncbi:MAG: DUF4851 domain-containing protein [Desulfovibrio sp.]|jgi:hypothetical protein|nr:DUF4851 domain-containing protein [Desulfovibrio sp.]